ncbi:hypothetical protein AMATHDRAFT_3775 [Amanita thiersii Skay4041]|uniref:Retrotransposon gag domain-containing protein n=1 Tax=Amanita thiersii Skay4041 TaxID=703135 RepID=A0A2A9NSC1_9AGAR|nr:hypothetical protein AMATHDRAFT_3775 [Amanita thiersii Skay4041]
MSTQQQSALERQVWELFCEELGLHPDSDEPLTDEQEAQWQQIRRRYITTRSPTLDEGSLHSDRGSRNETSDLESVYSETRAPDDEPDQPSSPESIDWLSDELQRLNMEQQAAAAAAKAQAKQYRRIIQDPGEFNGEKVKFRKWHLNMKSFLKGYHNLNDDQKILIFLSWMKGGEAELWANIKHTEVNGSTPMSFATFKTKLTTRFEDKLAQKRARNAIYTFRQAEASQEEAYFLLKRGLNDSVIRAAFGGFNVIPTTYTLLVKELKTLTANYEEGQGLIQSHSSNPFGNKEQYPMQDVIIVANLVISVENARIPKWTKEPASIVRRRTTWQKTVKRRNGMSAKSAT